MNSYLKNQPSNKIPKVSCYVGFKQGMSEIEKLMYIYVYIYNTTYRQRKMKIFIIYLYIKIKARSLEVDKNKRVFVKEVQGQNGKFKRQGVVNPGKWKNSINNKKSEFKKGKNKSLGCRGGMSG